MPIDGPAVTLGARKQALCGEGQRRSGTVNGVAGSPRETERGWRLQPEGWRLEPFQPAYAEHRGDACTQRKKARQQKTHVGRAVDVVLPQGAAKPGSEENGEWMITKPAPVNTGAGNYGLYGTSRRDETMHQDEAVEVVGHP